MRLTMAEPLPCGEDLGAVSDVSEVDYVLAGELVHHIGQHRRSSRGRMEKAVGRRTELRPISAGVYVL